MGDLDINLIKEYARRPGLYDRNSPYYKDRMYITQNWNEMSQKLGFEVRLLKERMLQLRNRYNLEKRRLDTLRVKYPNRIVRSQWPLFIHMDFMNGHIKHRRSFSKMTTRQYRPMSMEGDTRSQSPPPMTRIHTGSSNALNVTNTGKSLSNGEIEIKCENTIELEEEQSPFMNLDQDNFMDDDTEGVRDSGKQDYLLRPQVTLGQQDLDGNHRIRNTGNFKSHMIDDDFYERPLYSSDVREKKRMARLQKYETFGKFLAMSLCDMPENKAMKLVEKFTSDLVKSFLSIDDVIVTVPVQQNVQQNKQPIIQNVETVTKQQQQQQQQQHQQQQQQQPRESQPPSLQEIKKNETPNTNASDETNAVPTTSNSNPANYMDGEEYDDDDHFIFDLTEDEPLSV